jgi:hypothetical protein
MGRRVLPDDRGDLRERAERPDEDPVEQRAGDPVRSDLTEPGVVVGAVAVRRGEIDEPVVGLVRRTVLRVPVGEVAARVGRHAARWDDQLGEGVIPGRGVVEAGLPWVDHDRQPRPGRTAEVHQVAVLGHETRIEPAQEGY